MAQRLVRTICPDCKTPYKMPHDEYPMDFPFTPEIIPLAPVKHDGPAPALLKGTGCRSCRNSGYRGRTGIHELLVNNDVLKELIVQRVNAGLIRNEALKAGMLTLRQDGWKKVHAGTTTLDEICRTTAGDIIA
jgi:general secretion pathway protein E/type IV pilus assembly protein PilB